MFPITNTARHERCHPGERSLSLLCVGLAQDIVYARLLREREREREHEVVVVRLGGSVRREETPLFA
jgi:hypothetical protein